MLLNVTVPTFNEEACLVQNLRRLAHFLDERFPNEYEIVIADNGSTDDSLKLANGLVEDFKTIRVLHLDQAGRGGALKAAWQSSEASLLSYMDADLSSDLAAFPRMVQELASAQCDIAVGSRLLKLSNTRRSWKRELTSRVYMRLLKASFRVGFSDAQCGFKGIRREAAIRLLPMVQDNGWFFDTELLILAERNGWRILDVPVAWDERKDSRVRVISTVISDLKGIVRLRRYLRQMRNHFPNTVTSNRVNHPTE